MKTGDFYSFLITAHTLVYVTATMGPPEVNETSYMTTNTITSELNCLENIEPPNPKDLVSIEWFRIKHENLRKKIFEYEFQTMRISHYISKLKNRTIFQEEKPFSLAFSNSELEDDGLYECIIKHTANGKEVSQFKTYIKLEVPHEPTAIYIEDVKGNTIKGNYLNLTEGDLLKLTCIVLNGFPRPFVEWQLDNNLIRGTISNLENLNDVHKPKTINIMSPITISHEHSGAKLTCKAMQDTSLKELMNKSKYKTINIRVHNKTRKTRDTDQNYTYYEKQILPHHLTLPNQPRKKEQIFKSNNKTVKKDKTHAKNFSHMGQSTLEQIDHNVKIPTMQRGLLLNITKNIYCITVMIIIIIALLIIIYAINRCENNQQYYENSYVESTTLSKGQTKKNDIISSANEETHFDCTTSGSEDSTYRRISIDHP